MIFLFFRGNSVLLFFLWGWGRKEAGTYLFAGDVGLGHGLLEGDFVTGVCGDIVTGVSGDIVTGGGVSVPFLSL